MVLRMIRPAGEQPSFSSTHSGPLTAAAIAALMFVPAAAGPEAETAEPIVWQARGYPSTAILDSYHTVRIQSASIETKLVDALRSAYDGVLKSQTALSPEESSILRRNLRDLYI